MPAAPRVTFVTDILTPYFTAVYAALAERVPLTVVYCSESGTRAMEWDLRDRLTFRHEIVGGLTIRRPNPDATDFYLSPRIFAAIARSRPDAVIAGAFSFPAMYAAAYAGLRGIP